MSPDTKDRDAIGITTVNDSVMKEDEFAEPGRPVLDRTPNLGKISNPPERRQEDALVHIALPGIPLLLRVGENLANVAVGPWRNDNLNT